ncbi:hypothetical protein [Steroidobacter gossypii]|uniref:hypothetical protein n=1 Tax=Steroidobacter gossypii TaxID=2805490 RepID=UPI001C3F6A56|nr:hypothetical protein [Steroidobacter gossypii]
MAVLTLHGLFLLALLMRDYGRVITRASVHRNPTLFFIEEVPRLAVTEPQPSLALQPAVVQPPTAIAPIDAGESANTPAVTPSTETPAIDWRTQATQAASDAVNKAIRQEARKCDPSEKPDSFLPPCTRREHKFEWNPEEPRVGFSGGLPYIRLGERCAIGLGFFGCGFGAKPPANGDLFEHMDDPERDRSSVPALDDRHSQRQHVPSLPEPDSAR